MTKPAARLGRRPVFIASYSAPIAGDGPKVSNVAPEDPRPRPKSGIRYDFPTAGTEREGGISDGYCFRILFAAGRLERTYDMIRDFLVEQGYGQVPVPKDVAELRAFRLPPKLRHQLSLFGEDGYVHNPLKILFPPKGGKRGSLVLELYDEAAERHLLRFHRRG